MLLQLLGALVALSFVLVSAVGVSRLVTEHLANKRLEARASERSQTLSRIESELEKLEALKSNRSSDDDAAYARLIRRRNFMVAA